MAKEAIPYPDLPPEGCSRAVFWRAVWLRNLAELEAMQRLTRRLSALKGTDEITLCALYSARRYAQKDMDAALQDLIGAGGLLFAWAPSSSTAS